MRIGIDLGGTKIEAVALAEDGRVLFRQRVPTPRHDYDATIETIAALVAAIERDLLTTGTVGVALPGAVRERRQLLRAAHGDSSGVRGAAWLWT